VPDLTPRDLPLELRRLLIRDGEFPDPLRTSSAGFCGLTLGLTPELVLQAYSRGIFPMAEGPGLLAWWSPDPRTILDLEAFHVSRRLARTVRQGRYALRRDVDFPGVLAGCADRPQTWISPEIAEVYGELFRRGQVHTVEVCEAGELVGGLYGVGLHGAFMAESMFHTARDASKVAVVHLVEHLRARGMQLLDIQYETQATSVFQPRQIPRRDYLARLRAALASPASFS